MSEKKVQRMWAASLLIIGIITIINSVCNIVDITLTDWFIRLIGIIQLISLAILAYSTVRLYYKKGK